MAVGAECCLAASLWGHWCDKGKDAYSAENLWTRAAKISWMQLGDRSRVIFWASTPNWEAEWESRKQYSCCQLPNKFISGKPITRFLNKTVIKACLGDATCAVQVHSSRVKVVTRSCNKQSSSNFLFLAESVTPPLPFIVNSGRVKESLVHSKPLQVLLWRLLDPFPSEEGSIERGILWWNRTGWSDKNGDGYLWEFVQDGLRIHWQQQVSVGISLQEMWKLTDFLILMFFMTEFNS